MSLVKKFLGFPRASLELACPPSFMPGQPLLVGCRNESHRHQIFARSLDLRHITLYRLDDPQADAFLSRRSHVARRRHSSQSGRRRRGCGSVAHCHSSCTLAPAIRLSASDPNRALRAGSAGAGTALSQHRLRSAFVITQVALSLVLLVVSGLLLKNLQGLLHTDFGIDLLPIQASGDGYGIHITGQPPYSPNLDMSAETRFVSAGYFDAMGLQLMRGRLLSPSLDKAENLAGTMVVNPAFQHKFFPAGGDPVCAHIDDAPKPELKSGIVGVVTNVKQALREPQMAEMDWLMDEIAPKDRLQSLSSMALIVRSNGDLKALVPQLRDAVYAIDPTVPFKTPETMNEIVSDSLTLDRLEGWLFGVFAALALLLAVIGLYGLVNHEVELRPARSASAWLSVQPACK